MFKNLQDTIKALNADVKNVANCEKAKKLRKKLIAIGLSLAIFGGLGTLICFISFATVRDHNTALIPFCIIMPMFVIMVVGISLVSYGLKIIVTGYTTNLIDETVGNNCPNCNNTISSESLFCVKCGAKIKKECSNCKHLNSLKNDFCEKCGNKLD